MRSRLPFYVGAASILAQAVFSAPSTGATFETRAVDNPCSFVGNSDFYGIGVRLGFYLQWIAGLIAFVLNPADCEPLADAQTIFLLANLVAIILLQVQDAANTNVVVPILLFYMFFGGSISAVTSATASLEGWKKAITTRKIALIARQVFVQLTFFGLLLYSFYFWTKGLRKFKHFPDSCGGTYVFPVAHRVSVDGPSAGAVLGLLFLVLFYLLIWVVSYKRLRRTFGWKAFLPAKRDGVVSFVDEAEVGPPWEKRQLPWTILGGTLITLVIIWSIAGIELTLVWNNVTGVNELSSTSQLIPFIIGIAAVPSAIWGPIENWQEIKAERAKSARLEESKPKMPPGSHELLPSPTTPGSAPTQTTIPRKETYHLMDSS